MCNQAGANTLLTTHRVQFLTWHGSDGAAIEDPFRLDRVQSLIEHNQHNGPECSKACIEDDVENCDLDCKGEKDGRKIRAVR